MVMKGYDIISGSLITFKETLLISVKQIFT